MVVYHAFFAYAVLFPLFLGCSAPDAYEASSPEIDDMSPDVSCGSSAPDGKRCIGWDAADKRGWTGFCVAGECTEYVAAKCRVSTGVYVGCDGSGTVTGGLAITFQHDGRSYTCRGSEGEFGYCAPGDVCVLSTPEYQESTLLDTGICE